ncbi:MAG: hypothetical protein GF353_29185 [Candidatus Lokiarchaeota archaeon]|nr:hypothetical protein [Candidatus Lokiarchaeota archaeon]
MKNCRIWTSDHLTETCALITNRVFTQQTRTFEVHRKIKEKKQIIKSTSYEISAQYNTIIIAKLREILYIVPKMPTLL